ncbi:MAG: tail fiber domain-containing protein [Paracoccaceae bacterium]
MTATPTTYSTGTITATNGSATISGSGTAFVSATIEAGDLVMLAGLIVPIAAVTGETGLTLARPWPGASLSGADYHVLRVDAETRALTRLEALLGSIEAGSLKALSDLTGAADRIPYFTGAATMDLAPVTSFARSLLDDTDAAAARATLGMGALGFNGGNVGIGTANPPYKLVISNSGASGIEYGPGYSGTSNLIQHYNRSGGAYCDAVNDAAQHRFNIAGAEKLRLNTSGDLLVGTTSAGGAGGTTVHAGGYVTTNRSATTAALHHAFNNPNGQVGSIITTGSSTSFNTSSDYRLKRDVVPMAGSTDRVLALNPVNFAWRADGSRVDGFLAHEVQAVIPEAVTGAKDAMQTEDYEVAPAEFDADGNQIAPAVIGTREVPVYQSIDHSKLIPVLTAALQEALRRIEVLEQNLT